MPFLFDGILQKICCGEPGCFGGEIFPAVSGSIMKFFEKSCCGFWIHGFSYFLLGICLTENFLKKGIDGKIFSF